MAFIANSSLVKREYSEELLRSQGIVLSRLVRFEVHGLTKAGFCTQSMHPLRH